MTTKNSHNKEHEYICECCKYITNNKKDFNKHLMTSKHKIMKITTKMSQKSQSYLVANVEKNIIIELHYIIIKKNVMLKILKLMMNVIIQKNWIIKLCFYK